MNSTNTHLTIKHNNINWIFTCSYGQCNQCINIRNVKDIKNVNDVKDINDISDVYLLCQGYPDHWDYQCMEHLTCCKKQLCNYCNKKSVIKTRPFICQDCITGIIDNTVEMINICKFPVISRDECLCKYCIKYKK
jgi:hypothetical protein